MSNGAQANGRVTSFVLAWSRWFERMPRWFRLTMYTPIVALVAFSLGNRRGWIVGVAAGLFYGVLFVGYAIFPRRIQEWSRNHVYWDATLFIPLLFFAMLFMLPQAPIWVLTLVAMGIGGIVVPLMVRRRRQFLACEAAEAKASVPGGARTVD